MSIIDARGRQLAANPAFAELFGFDLDELGSFDVATMTQPEDRAFADSYRARIVAGELQQFATAKRYLCADGSERTARLRARAIRDANGSFVAVLGTFEPIDEIERIDDARLRRFLQYAQATYTLLDSNGVVIESSGRYQKALGYPPEFWDSRSLFEVIQHTDRKRIRNVWSQLLAEPGVPFRFEVGALAADGSLVTLMAQAVNLIDDDEVGGVVLTTQNVTEQRLEVRELAERRKEAEAVAAARSHLLATVSHELRNPLHAVQGIAELLAAESLPPRAAALATSLAQQIAGLASVTADLLDAARFEAGEVSLEITTVEISSLVDEAVEYGRMARADRAVDVASSIEDRVRVSVRADRNRLRQILRNLVGNAVKFTESGLVTVGVDASDAGIRFVVTDTGVGIPPEEVESILTPFVTGSTGGTHRGAGLGLSIVQRLVRAMGGTLSVTSELGRGSTFTVDLPLRVVSAEDRLEPPRGAVEIAGKRVLVVEDNPVNRTLARNQLARLDLDVVMVETGEDALALLASSDERFDAILMDQQLPGIDGIETTRRIRELGRDVSAVPVIALTASASRDDRHRFALAGYAGLIVKPASLADLECGLREALVDGEVSAQGRDSRNKQAVGDRAPSMRTDRVTDAMFESIANGITQGINGGDNNYGNERPADVSSAFRNANNDASGSPTIDLSVLTTLTQDLDAGIVGDLVATYLRELPDRSKNLVAALAANDAIATRRHAHSLKSSSRLLGVVALADECAAIEKRGTADSKHVEVLIEQAADALRAWKPSDA